MTIVGEAVEITAKIEKNAVLTDPTTLVLIVTDPLGTPTTYTWPPDGIIIRQSVGQFTADIVALRSGKWTFVWGATGTVTSQQKGEFVVDPAPETVTLEMVTDDTIPLPIAGVDVKLFSGPLTVVAGGLTNLLGELTVQVPPGVLKIDASKSKVDFSPALEISVVDTGGNTPQTFTLAGHALTIAAAAAPRRVRLFGYAVGDAGAVAGMLRIVIEGVSFGSRAFLPSGGSGVDSALVSMIPGRRETYTDPSGYWEASVIAGAWVKVSIPDLRFERIFQVPDDTRITSWNIRDARPMPGPGGSVGISTDVPERDTLRGPG